LERADSEKGTWREYLKQALRNLAIDYHRQNRKEGCHAHPDQVGTGGWDVMGLAELPAAEAAFHLAWAKVTLADALSRVRTLCHKRKQEVHLHLFEAGYLGEAGRAPSWKELGAPYGMDQKTAREHADTVVRHFRLVLRRMLANEIAVSGGSGRRRSRVPEAAIAEEINRLLSPLQD
jgi:hypothetical protein